MPAMGGDMTIDIGLNADIRTEVIAILNKILANEFILYIKTLKFHWNIESADFAALHELFKVQYEQLLTIADDVAERARALGGVAIGTSKEFLEHATLIEKPGDNPSDVEMLTILCKDHEELIRQLRIAIKKIAQIGDDGTSNFLTELLEKHEKIAWMLRASVPAK
jgi:starvation-inducible DNA-binding protein